VWLEARWVAYFLPMTIPTSSMTLPAPALAMMWARWVSTVRSLMPRSAAMTLLRLPSTMAPRIFQFARSQRLSPVVFGGESGSGVTSFVGKLQGGVDPFKELLHIERLFQKVESAEPHGAYGRWHVGIAGEKDHRYLGISLPQPVVHLGPGNAWHADVEQHAAGIPGSPAAHEVLSGGILLGSEADAGQHLNQETANLYVVIDNANALVRG
jgi:hypothetical protein